MNNSQKEYRYNSLQTDSEKRTIEGYAIVFNSYSEDMGFREIILPNALEGVIERSDVYALLNHERERGVLARSKYGNGSLELTVDDIGLRYKFEAPNTELGEQTLEHIRRGEIDSSSFGFTVAENGQEWSKEEDGTYIRTITHIDRLFDVSPVFSAAYSETSVTCRSFEEFKNSLEENRELTEEEEKEINDAKLKIAELETQLSDKEKTEEINSNLEEENKELQEEIKALEEEKETDIEETPKEEPTENETENEPTDGEPTEEEEEEDTEETKENRNYNTNNKFDNINIMEKNYSLIEEIRNSVKSGEKIVLEERSNGSGYTVDLDGSEIVAKDYFNVLAPLREKSVLAQAGAHFINGLVNDVRVPIMGAQNVTWEGETADAKDGSAAFTHVDLSPKRITAYVDISLQFLNQDSVGAEQLIRQDIVNALNSKIEGSVLSDFSGSTTQPKGIFAEIGSATTATTFADICAAEASVEDANVYGNMVYVGSNKFKAGVRAMAKGAKSTQLVYENGTIDGTPLYNTSLVGGYKAIYGDFSNLYIGTWGNTEIDVVRDSVSLKKGCVTLVINAYVDFKVVRPTAFKAITLQ